MDEFLENEAQGKEKANKSPIRLMKKNALSALSGFLSKYIFFFEN